ncbi:hypothetical protein D1818_23795 [Aquimarina sp. BL5]|uniref:hypothetical protein n=1 Tax=Aquimarina sp. BL5 TaxID=1714860 RepID=UPI000E4EF834|nr:hypothetical protein [Aquimarina sp. BL5]AXT53700.1 hypothetical protein D1818_23795 [Aquimarina sp. BL5]RKN01825.1 hypothetical protein D7036_17285 [Aquimarina sp. BL5]
MKNIIIKITLSVLLLSFFSCAKKVYFNEQELEKFNVYERGDALVFKNINTKQIDTSIIISKDITYDWQLFANSKYKTPIAILKYSNKTLPGVSVENQDDMIAMSKSKPTSERIYSVSYLKSHFLFKEDITLQSEDLCLIDKSFDNVYKLPYDKKNTRGRNKFNNNPEFLYWDVDYGIIKYITFNGDIWERINW